MFDLDGALLSPDRRPLSLGEITGNRGLIIVGVGRAGERGFQMVHRFHDAGEQLATAGVHLAFVYPRESARHVMDPLSAASVRLRPHPRLLLDVNGCCFRHGVAPRSLAAVYLGDDMQLLASVNIDLLSETWETRLRAFLEDCRNSPPH
jgi:hypothetical protein